jgi:proteasome beta subunit
LTIPTEAGVVLASDSQVTSGAVRAPGEKLYQLNDHCGWSAAGEVALAQRVAETVGASASKPLTIARDDLATTIKEAVESLLRVDFRTQFFSNSPDHLLQLHQGDFVFAECRPDSRPCILHITSYGTPEWIEARPYAIGSGAPFAFALLRKYHGLALDLERASLLAFKVLEEAIDVGAYGLGRPLHIWQITPQGIVVLDEAKQAALEDFARELREAEIQSLFRGLPALFEEENLTDAGSAEASAEPQ